MLQLRTFALDRGNGIYLDHVMELQAMTAHIRMEKTNTPSKISNFFQM